MAPIMIGVLVFPDFQLLDAAGPISVFEIAARFAGQPPSIKVLAATPGPVRSSSGVELLARGLRPIGAISTLIVAGGEGVDAAARCEKTLAFVRAVDIWSSAGISAGIDLALALVAEDFGDEIAQQTARQLVLYHRRNGGQSQFSSLLELKAPAGRFGPLLAWAREHLDAPLTVEDMAEQAGMSSRHFARAFIAETGTTQSKAEERLGIEVARQRVQSSSEAIERVAQVTGFRDPERMRRAFIRAFGQPPQSLRRASRAG